MDIKNTVNTVIEEKGRFFSISLSVVFFAISVIHGLLIILGKSSEPMWMLFGTFAIFNLLVNVPKNMLTAFAVIIFGTFVADEEFLLEVASLTRGEQLAAIRESRNFETLNTTLDEESRSVLTQKLEEILGSETSPQEIINTLENHRIELEIKDDLPRLEPIDRDVVYTFATEGALTESTFFNAMIDKGYSTDEISDSFVKLGAAEYLVSISDGDENQAMLSLKGKALANAFTQDQY